MKEFIFIWKIQNISYSWHKPGEFLESPIFYAGPMQNTGWTLTLYPRGNVHSDFLSLYLNREKDDVCINLAFNFELSIISENARPLHSSFIPESFHTFMHGENQGFGDFCFIKRYEVFERRKALYLPKDALTLCCRMWKNEGIDNESGKMYGLTRLTIEKIISVENINLEDTGKQTILIKSKNQNKELLSVTASYFNVSDIEVEINPSDQGNIRYYTFKFAFWDKKHRKKLCGLVSSFYGIPVKEKWRLPFADKSQTIEKVELKNSDYEFITEFVYSTGDEFKILKESSSILEDIPRISEFLSNYINSHAPSGKLTDFPTISKDLWNLYVDQVLCDVKLKTKNKSFLVHKFVLCARSPVFLSNLTADMKEKSNGCIEIDDIGDEILEKFLHFLYSDTFEDYGWDAVIRLYCASDKYNVERLKLLCCSYLMENLDAGNVCELLILADTHSDCELKRKVNDFIWQNEDGVFRSSLWRKLASERQALALETMLSKYEDTETNNPIETYEDRLSSVPTLQDDFESFLHSHTISDVVIRTDTGQFSAHKIVLCASSGEFRECLTDDTEDFQTNSDKAIFAQMLLFLYTDSLGFTQWDDGIELYKLAIIYRIQRLQIKSSCFLLHYLTVTNAADVLLLAHAYGNDAKLKSVVEDFILKHDEEIFGSDEWAKFSKDNLLLAYKTMVAKYKRGN